ncbi:MFGE8 [Branchiostoma lanceolatum]|uniref:chitin synthase n=1 Tax=Branchiostoma lanceolatum TaxID=7740 RepID=A0A8K0EHY0_BRALA|nr:MFGE8 [Branchiostoma lanceolatum]
MSTNESTVANGQPGKRLSNISEERSTPNSTPPETKRMTAGDNGPSVANGRVPSSPAPKTYAGAYEPSLTVNIRNIEADVSYGAVGGTHICLKVLKLVLSILIGIIVLACLTVSRLSIIGITKTFRNQSLLWENDTLTSMCRDNETFAETAEVKVMESTVVMVEYILMFPYGVSLFRSVWNGAFQASMPWPHVKAAVLGVVLSFLEVFGLCLFTLRVMPSVAPSISLVLSNGIFFVPIILQVVKHSIKLSKVRIRKHLGLFFYILASIILALACGGLVAAWCVYRAEYNKWEVPVSLLSLSVAWAPFLQEYQTGEGTEADHSEQTARSKKKSRAQDVTVEDPDGIFFGRQKSEIQVQTVDHLGSNVKENARWKAGIINNFFKLVFVLLVPEALRMMGLVEICSPWAWAKPHLYTEFNMDHPAIESFIVNVCCSFGGYVLAWMACTIRMQFFGFALPLCIATNVAFTIAYVEGLCKYVTLFIPVETCEANLNEIQWDVPVTAGLLLIQFLSTTWFVMRSPTIVMEREASLFWLPGYSGVFPEQWLLLSRKNRNTKSEDFIVQKRTRQNAHVYICTTMYHEAEHEMEQLLTSLRGVAESQVGERTFESHIFFDGGCKQGQPSQWALQLLSLMDHTLKDGNSKESIINQCTKYKTPYGLQLHWDLHYDNGETESGMSFNIHLKDNTLVKNKKRWSQVMYMSYILDYAVYFSPIGVESKAIEDTDIKATSVMGHDSFNGPHRARLHLKRDANGAGGWTAGEFNDDQYLQIDLGEDMVFTGVVTQGKSGTSEWVTRYHLLYSDDGELWQYYKDDSGQPVEFEGNRDPDTPARQLLDKPITTRFVSFNPVQWNNRISMRVEVLGYSANDKDRDNFMLATDADVKFSPQSAKALLDIMTRDPNVGAVCARTHPLGSGPMVWYQMFDYAVGHWFQKVANSVLGTVLCCPGCFSVYRAKAVRDALPTYATKVTKAEEFLTKDMGEDRWFCTLLVEKGWRLEYTAVSEDSTYCPEEFDEFFNQRRRWIPSTVANQMELLRKWANGQMINDYISRLFILYQGFLLFSTMIGPSTVILIIAAGLELVVGNIGGSIIPTVVILFLVFVAYALLCVYTTQETQLKETQLKVRTAVPGVFVAYALLCVYTTQETQLKETQLKVRTAVPGVFVAYALLCVYTTQETQLKVRTAVLVFVAYALLCVYTTQETQLKETQLKVRTAVPGVFVAYALLCVYTTQETQLKVRTAVLVFVAYALLCVYTTQETQLKVFVAYALLCVYTTQETQLKWAKILTMLFTVVMVIVLIGQAREMVVSFQRLDARLSAESSGPAPSEEEKSCLECLRSGDCDDCNELDCIHPIDWTPGNVTTWIAECISDLGTFADNISRHFGRYDGEQLSLASKNEMCDEFDGPNGDFQMERDCQIIYAQFHDKIQNAEAAPTPSPPPTILQQLPLPISVIYFLGLAGLYVITALLHPSEFMTLVYGFVYLLSLPSGYILLIIYSVCNMTDRSWGTREIKTPGAAAAGRSFIETLSSIMKKICVCCQRDTPFEDSEPGDVVLPRMTGKSTSRSRRMMSLKFSMIWMTKVGRNHSASFKQQERMIIIGTEYVALFPIRDGAGTYEQDGAVGNQTTVDDNNALSSSVAKLAERWRFKAKEPRHVTGPSERRIGRQKSRTPRGRRASVSSSNWGSWASRKSHSPARPSVFSVALAASKGGKSFTRWRAGSLARSGSQTFVKDVCDWLPYYWPNKLKKKYEKKFRENGFENTTFISGMTDKDLQAIGIKNDFHRDILMKEIKKLTEYELPGDVPDNCREWLFSIGLDQYIKNFENYGIYSKNDMASLRSMDIGELLKDLKITKMAHINRISKAIATMRSPDESDRRISQVKSVISKQVKTRVMQQDDGRIREYKFWDTLRRECLDPDIALFSSDGDLRGKLVELRNMWLGVLLITNVLWITIVVSLTYIPELRLWDANPLSLLSLLVFGLLQLIQFLAMLYHRLRTLLHYIARLPYPLKVHAIKSIGSSKAEITIEDKAAVSDPMPSAGDLLTRRPTILGGNRRKGPTTFKTNPLFDNADE